MPRKIAELLNEETALEVAYRNSKAEIRTKKIALARAEKIHCTGCAKDFTFGTADFIQDHFGYSSTVDGVINCWQPSEIQTCSLRCPHCAALNYIYTHPQSQLIVTFLTFLSLTKEDLFKAIYDRKGTEIIPHEKGSKTVVVI